MEANTLAQRIKIATGTEPTDQYVLSGIFNRYRPDGAGLESIFAGTGVEGEVLSRLRQVFAATAPGWEPSDLYFIVKHFAPLEGMAALQSARAYLKGFKSFAEHAGDSDLNHALANIRVEHERPAGAEEDTDFPVMMYECLTDFLAQLQPERDGLFLLKEAFYSMANDYFLMAYILWPAIQLKGDAGRALDEYFNIWRHGIKLKFYKGGIATISLQG